MRRYGLTLAAALALVLAGCAASAPSPSPSPSAPPTTSAPATPTPTPDAGGALTLEQKVGQVFMVGTDVDSGTSASLSAIRDRHVGSIFLHGRSQAGAQAISEVVSQFTALVGEETTGGVPLWVATDQEGGEVQVLQGTGFEEMPYAIRQADLADADLQVKAQTWGSELAAAGVNMNLAPVADIVTSHDTRMDNPPIGALGRQYGYDEQTVAAKAGAFAAGMRAAGVQPTFKHFPGLGRVTANTDFTADVHDTVITADAPDVAVYRPLTEAGTSVVMVSTAYYDRIDSTTPAAFSAPVIQILRDTVGFDGVAMTDDLSAAAAAEQWSPADRAVLAITAGIDLVLASADPSVLPEMYEAVLAKAQSDPAFAQRVDEAAARVLAAKEALR